MKSKPILFSTPMVQAILEGRKTQTRRICKIPIKPMEEVMCTKETDPNDPEFSGFYLVKNNWVYHTESKLAKSLSPFGQIGDVLWVRETFCPTGSTEYLHTETNLPFFYKADVKEVEFAKEMMPNYGWKWKPSIFMPKDAARIWLKITDVRVQRLQDIDSGDAISEGIEFWWSDLFAEYRYKDYANVKDDWRSAVSSFQSLWSSINGINSWNNNPWVWVIEFERIEKPSEV